MKKTALLLLAAMAALCANAQELVLPLTPKAEPPAQVLALELSVEAPTPAPVAELETSETEKPDFAATAEALEQDLRLALMRKLGNPAKGTAPWAIAVSGDVKAARQFKNDRGERHRERETVRPSETPKPSPTPRKQNPKRDSEKMNN